MSFHAFGQCFRLFLDKQESMLELSLNFLNREKKNSNWFGFYCLFCLGGRSKIYLFFCFLFCFVVLFVFICFVFATLHYLRFFSSF